MADVDFGFDWGAEEEEEEEEERAIEGVEQTGGNSQASEEQSGAEDTPANGRLPPGVVVHRVAASDKQANPHGTTESSLNPVHQHLARQHERSKDMVIKTRASSPPAPVSTSSASGGVLATLFGRRSWQGDKASVQTDKELAQPDIADDGAAGLDALMGTFFVSPADEEARLELTRHKLLMLHMIHLVSVEFGAAMRPAVFVPVVERAAKDRAFEVRRDAAAVLGSLARAVSADLAVDVLFQCFLQLAQDPVWQVRQSAARHALPGLALVLAARVAEPSTERGDPAGLLAAFMYANQPPRPVADRQWLQLIERLAGPREPSHHVRAAVFESIGKLALALVDCARSRDALVELVVGDVQRAHSDTGSGRFGLFGSNTSLQDLDDDDDEEANDEAAEASSVMARALGTIQGVAAAASAPKPAASGSGLALALAASSSAAASAGRGKDAGRRQHGRAVGRDVLYQCAFNFPAVLASVGVAGWERLRDVFMQLSKTEHFEARQTLACSLHEVARILAASESENAGHSSDLESILCLFLIDGAEIKMGALRHLATRSRGCRVFKHDGKQWRTRELMASQLVKLCHLFPAAIVVSSLLPQAVEWAHDPVAGVRAAVAPAFPIVFELTKLDPSTQVKFFETVISFSHAATFRGRLFFVEICSALLAHDQDPDADPVDFDQFFLPSLAALASDRVANVRIALARLVRRMLENRMRRQSISTTLADMWVAVCPPAAKLDGNGVDAVDKSLRRITSEALIKSPSAESALSTAEPPLAGSMTGLARQMRPTAASTRIARWGRLHGAAAKHHADARAPVGHDGAAVGQRHRPRRA
ncbi:armadillo-type protein [Kickxella alabastrina]|uniref:armadillo-type protein n=1 Tax=Kickxella alabastrina TaxID=61397 RepID=UPI00221E89AF|nr:armadillo-type protein [Kickxella alabastrina]KAI7820869.1 armadillo-type protein [Kickxella alabastrina]